MNPGDGEDDQLDARLGAWFRETADRPVDLTSLSVTVASKKRTRRRRRVAAGTSLFSALGGIAIAISSVVAVDRPDPADLAGAPISGPTSSDLATPEPPAETWPHDPTSGPSGTGQPRPPKPRVAVDASALSYDKIILHGPAGTPDGWLPRSRLPELGPGRYGIQVASGQPPAVWFTVGADGAVDYEARYEPALDGRGMSTLVVTGVPITVDTGELASPEMTFASHSAQPVFGLGDYRLLPGRHEVMFGPGQVMPGSFEVTEQGRIRYDPALNWAADGYLEGNGSSRLTFVGYRVRIDARGSGATALLVANPVANLEVPSTGMVWEGNLLPYSGYRLILKPGVIACSTVTMALSTSGTLTLGPTLARHAELHTVDGVPTVRLTSTPPTGGGPGC